MYLILMSNVFSGYLKNIIGSFLAGKKPLEDNQEFIKNVALDWADRLDFVTAMVVALVSVFSIYAKQKNFDLAVGTFIFLLALFIPMMFWILGHDPGDLEAIKYRRFKITHAAMSRIILIIVNLVLLIAIYVNNR